MRQQELTIEDDDCRWPFDHLRIDLKAVKGTEVGMNFDGSELAYEDGPHAARRRCILGPGRATVLRQFRLQSPLFSKALIVPLLVRCALAGATDRRSSTKLIPT